MRWVDRIVMMLRGAEAGELTVREKVETVKDDTGEDSDVEWDFDEPSALPKNQRHLWTKAMMVEAYTFYRSGKRKSNNKGEGCKSLAVMSREFRWIKCAKDIEALTYYGKTEMGNESSTFESSPLSRHNSNNEKNVRKLSASPPRRNASFSSSLTTPSTTHIRRSKTCRVKDRCTTRRMICSITGLTIHQKALITRKWNRMDKGTIHELGRRVFESVFVENPTTLSYIGLKDEQEWKNTMAFKMHVQRFVCALSECIRRMKEPSSACDILRDFGASYVQNGEKKRVPATFFEKLANSLNDAARQLQESDHLTVERARSVSADDPSESSSEGGITSDTTTTTSATVLPDQFRPSICSSVGITNTHSSPSFLHRSDEDEEDEENYAPCMGPQHAQTNLSFSGNNSLSNGSDKASERDSGHSSESAICPITSEAWLVFAVFVANQIKFGYELERVLQGEMSKLGLNGPKKSIIQQSTSTEIALFNN